MAPFFCSSLTAGHALAFLLATNAQAGAPYSYRELWCDPAVNERIPANIETRRKGDATLEVVNAAGKPVSGAKIVMRQENLLQTEAKMMNLEKLIAEREGVSSRGSRSEGAGLRAGRHMNHW